VVVSRRLDGQNALAGAAIDSRGRAGSTAGSLPPPPTIDEVAQAVVRATQVGTSAHVPSQEGAPSNAPVVSSTSPARPITTGPINRLDQLMGLNDIGDAGLRDQVNQHYKSTFGASAAVGLISGFAQYLGTAGFNRGNGDRTVIVTGGVSDAAAQSTARVMNRY